MGKRKYKKCIISDPPTKIQCKKKSIEENELLKTDKDNSKLWGGRFSLKTDECLHALNCSISYDKRMCQQDILGSIHYSRALRKINLLNDDQQNQIENGLKTISIEWKENQFIITPEDEDIHTANERRLKELIGSVGGMLHTGRSRNDQVALDMRMWLKDHIKNDLVDLLKILLETLLRRANEESNIILPGYTHLQRAQPTKWSHYLMSHAWSLFHDLQKLRFVFWSTDICPLGSGALAGNPFEVDRQELGRELNFSRVSQNSLQAVADRDFVAEYLFWCSLTSCHLSRLAEDLILYSSSEFGFVKLSDSFTTGSSLMPQKKNPDSLELIRGKAGRMIGNVTGFLSVLKGLPTTYNKDLQEDKEMLFDSADTLMAVLKITNGTVDTLTINKDKCFNALSEDMLATDLAYFLVRKGVPFRSAHEKAGQVVKKAEDLNCTLSEVPLHNLQEIDHLFNADVSKIWSFENSVEQYSVIGGTSSSSVQDQIDNMKKELAAFKLDL